MSKSLGQFARTSPTGEVALPPSLFFENPTFFRGERAESSDGNLTEHVLDGPLVFLTEAAFVFGASCGTPYPATLEEPGTPLPTLAPAK